MSHILGEWIFCEEWGKRGDSRIASPWRKCDTPSCGLWKMRMENGNGNYRVVRRDGTTTASQESRPSLQVMLPVTAMNRDPKWNLQTLKVFHSPFFTLRGEEWISQIFGEWGLHHSRRACHVPILRRLRMGWRMCNYSYYYETSWSLI